MCFIYVNFPEANVSQHSDRGQSKVVQSNNEGENDKELLL